MVRTLDNSNIEALQRGETIQLETEDGKIYGLMLETNDDDNDDEEEDVSGCWDLIKDFMQDTKNVTKNS